MAGESLFRRAMSAIGDIGILTPESRAVQADIAKQRAQRYANFMESIPGAKGKFNLAPDAAPVVRLASGQVRVLPKGAEIPKDAQLLNKSRAEIDQIVYNRPKEYDPHVAAALGAGAVATPVILAAETSAPGGGYASVPPAAEQPYISPDAVATYGASGPAQEMRFPPSRSQDTLPPAPAPQQQAAPQPQAVQAARELLESRLDRARASDAPTDIGSPAGNMAFPHNIPPQAQMPAPAPARQSRPMAAPMPPRRSDVLGTTGGESAASSYGGNPFRAAWSDGLQGGTYGAPDDRYVGAFAQAAERERKLREAGDGESPAMARGGAAQKGMNGRDAALHKALEIIHHMLSRR